MKRSSLTLYSLVLLLMVVATGCEEKISVDLNDTDPKLVVDAYVRNWDGPQVVYLTLSSSYFANEPNPPALGALVTITKDGGKADTLIEAGQGFYGTLSTQGEIGSTYQLRIEYDGEVYEATSYMAALPEVDSLTYQFEAEEPFIRDEGYYVYIHTQEPDTLGNAYRFLYYTNGRIESLSGIVTSDEFVNGSYISYSFDYDYTHEIGDTAVVELLSISTECNTFYMSLYNQESTGDLFDTPPGNIKGNISNGGFGFFQASDVYRDTIIIQ